MAKTIVLGKTPYRVLRRSKTAITIHPMDSEYPHLILLARSVADPKRAEWRGQWGLSRDSNHVTWYEELTPDLFTKVT